MTRKFFFLSSFLLLFFALAIPASTPAQVAVGISVRIGPPPLRVYAQPLCPGPGYLWTPGYWAYGPDGYYWVPGAWVMAPQPGLLWTPGYWGFAGGVYAWHAGYWGPHVGFYGGINYGFGYGGVGFAGGEWRGGRFYYNRAYSHIDVNIHNTYERRVVFRDVGRASFNGEGGVRAEPTRDEMAAEHERHFDATREQMDHRDMAQHDPGAAFHDDHGRGNDNFRNGNDRANDRGNDHGNGNDRGNGRGNARGNQRADNRQSHNNQARPQHNNNKPQHESKAKPQRKPDDHPRFR